MPLIQTAVDLTPFNTLGLPARASHFIRLTSGAEIAALRAEQAKLAAQNHELRARRLDRRAILAAEVGDGLVVRRQPPR